MARQFSEAEARRIFERAAARQHAAPTSSGGLTLQELQEIGAAAGLDPEHVAAAVTEAESTPTQVPTWQGVPLRTTASRLIPEAVSDDAWMRIVDQMRAQHQTPGVMEREGRRRVWRQYEGSLTGASVTASPSASGTLVTVESTRANEDVVTYTLGGLAGFMGGLGLLVYLVKDKPGGLILIGLMAAFAVALVVATSLSVRRRARSRPGHTEALLDRIEGEVRRTSHRPTAPESEPTSSDPEADASVDRLGFDALGPEEGAASEASSTPRRTRS